MPHARIAKFEGDPDRMDEAIDAARKQAEANWDSPPEGLGTAKELWMLIDRENATGLGITVFETEEDMRRADETLNAMSPQAPGARRTNVAFYEVGLHKQRD
jgi:hypothetical protein